MIVIKNIGFYVSSAVILSSSSHAVFKKNLNMTHRLQTREISGKQSFPRMTIKDQNFSGMNLRGMDFQGYTFINVDFSNADLTDAQFDGSTFEKVNLVGAVSYCPLDDNGQAIIPKAFRVDTNDLYELLNKYSNLMNNYEESQNKEFFNQARSLNKFFCISKKDLRNADLSDFNLKCFDLREIDLENVYLGNVQLQGAILPRGFIVPNYPEKDRTILFKAWCFGGEPHQEETCQKLVNAGFDIITGVDLKLLCKGLQSKKDLRNANLYTAQLQDADLRNTNLENANLAYANLAYASLRGANLQGANLHNVWLYGAWLKGVNLEGAILIGADLSGAHLSDSFQVPDPCRDEDLIGIYRSCTDPEGKRVLEQILKGKAIPLD